jgi:hypothetical protein
MRMWSEEMRRLGEEPGRRSPRTSAVTDRMTMTMAVALLMRVLVLPPGAPIRHEPSMAQTLHLASLARFEVRISRRLPILYSVSRPFSGVG